MNQRIVCAANRISSINEIVLGARHYDAFMHNSLRRLLLCRDPIEQGFIDNKGNFLSRTEAWKVAEREGQIIRRVGGDEVDGGTLYSENLY